MAEPTFQQLTEQVQRLTQRVAALEKELGTRPRVPVAEPLPSKPKTDFESKVGLRFVNRVGAVTLILGIAFFFRYAVENNWMGESARVSLAAFAGLALTGGGEVWFRRGERIFAQGISGAGVAIFYLSCYAAFDLYHLISLAFTVLLLTGATMAAAYLATRYRSEAMAILALFGGLLAPWILQSSKMDPWFVPVYVALLDAAFLALAERQGWRKLEWAALAGTVLFTVEMAEVPLRAALPVYYALFATRPNRNLFLAAHALLLGRATFLPHRLSVYAPNLLVMSAAAFAVLRWRKWNGLAAAPIVAAGLSWSLAGTHLPLAGALATLAVLFVIFLATTETVAIPLNAALFFVACYARLRGWGNSWAALLACALALLYFALAYRFGKLARTVCGITGHVFLLTSIALEVVDKAGHTNAASAAISILFAAYAVVLVAIGTATRTAANRYLGLGLIALVVVKLYLYDVWQLDMVYRFIAFAALGALLLTTSFLYSRFRGRIASWLTSPAASEAHPPPRPE